MQSLYAHGGTNPEQPPSIEQTFSRDAVGGYINHKYSIFVKMRMFLILRQPVLRTSTWNRLKPVPTSTHYLRSTLILLCHV